MAKSSKPSKALFPKFRLFLADDVMQNTHHLQYMRFSRAGSNAGAITGVQQANIVLMALVQMLLAKETDGEADDADTLQLESIAKSSELASKLESSSLPEDGYAAVERLAWGLLLADHAPPNLRCE